MPTAERATSRGRLVAWLVALSLLTLHCAREAHPPPWRHRLVASPFPHRRASAMAEPVAGVARGWISRTGGRWRRQGRGHYSGCCGWRRLTEAACAAAARIRVHQGLTVDRFLQQVLPDRRRDRAAAIEPEEWTLRIHGIVSTAGHAHLRRPGGPQPAQGSITLDCIFPTDQRQADRDALVDSSALPISPGLPRPEAGARPASPFSSARPRPERFDVLRPVGALTDDRNTLLAVAMNGRPLPIDHGFPVRTIVPGCTATSPPASRSSTRRSRRSCRSRRMDRTRLGEYGTVKMSSRIDVPRSGEDVASGSVTLAVSPGHSTPASRGWRSPSTAVPGSRRASQGAERRTSVQSRSEVDVGAGNHLVGVRATDRPGRADQRRARRCCPTAPTGFTARLHLLLSGRVVELHQLVCVPAGRG